jgi:hypothetical protein
VTLPPAVLWVDPGKMTGIMEITYGGYHTWNDEKPFYEACMLIEQECEAYHSSLAIGWERFDINDQTHKKTQGGIKDALHMIGVCRYLSFKYGCRMLPEAHQHTPDLAEQRQLKRLGWWIPGKDDAQSAACHMLRWLMQEGELTPAQRELLYSGNQTA